MEWSAAQGGYIDPNRPKPAHPPSTPVAGIRRGILFFITFGILQFSWGALRGSHLEWLIVHGGTVRPAAWLINVVTPKINARAIDFAVRAKGGGLNILNGCEGLEALFLLIAAFAVAPISFRARLLGLLVGVPVVFVVNQARILALFYAYRSDHSLFDPLHGMVLPIVVVLVVACYFYAWLAYDNRHVAPST